MAEVTEVTHVKVTKDAGGEFRWGAYSDNNREVAASGEGFEHLQHTIKIAHDLYPDARVRVTYGDQDYDVDFTSPEWSGESE